MLEWFVMDYYVGLVRPMVIARNKYSHEFRPGTEGLERAGVDARFLEGAETLLGRSKAYNTHKVIRSSLNKVKQVELSLDIDLAYPWCLGKLCNFILACNEDALKASTIKNYVSQIKSDHARLGEPWSILSRVPNDLLKGIENGAEPSRFRIAVTPAMMLNFKRVLAASDWSRHNKRVMWCLIAFLWSGSFRVSELLAPSQVGYIQEETFVWRKLSVEEGEVNGVRTKWVSVHLKNTKEMRRRNSHGVKIEMFNINRLPWNPWKALEDFRARSTIREEPDMPVFRWEDGRCITPRFLNRWMKTASADLPGYPVSSLSTHSFRAGITSILGSLGVDPDLIKEVGRWRSDAWLRYAKEGRSIRKGNQMRLQEMILSRAADWEEIQIMEAVAQ